MHCKICGSSKLNKVHDEKHENEYFFCDKCEFVFIDREYMVDEKREKEVYDGHNNSFECEGYVNMFKEFLEKAVDPFIETKGNALEFGCGPGPVLAKLLEMRGWNVKTYDKFYDTNEDFDEYRYDLITSTEVFEHFKDPLKEIEMIVDLMKKGGYLSVMTLLRPEDEEGFLDWWYRRDPTHISFYSIRTFEYIANKFNLELIYTDDERIITFKKK